MLHTPCPSTLDQQWHSQVVVAISEHLRSWSALQKLIPVLSHTSIYTLATPLWIYKDSFASLFQIGGWPWQQSSQRIQSERKWQLGSSEWSVCYGRGREWEQGGRRRREGESGSVEVKSDAASCACSVWKTTVTIPNSRLMVSMSIHSTTLARVGRWGRQNGGQGILKLIMSVGLMNECVCGWTDEGMCLHTLSSMESTPRTQVLPIMAASVRCTIWGGSGEGEMEV